MDNNFQYDSNVRPIDRVEFGILGNDIIKRISAFGKDSPGLEIPDLYDNLEPKKGGLIDTRMGVTNNSLVCATCGFDSDNCIGHFGHIDLAEPVFHLEYLMYVKKILGCVCLKCSKLLIYKTEDEILEMLKSKSNKARFNTIRELIKNVANCQSCHSPVTKIKIETKKASASIALVSELEVQTDEGGEKIKKKIRQTLTPEICYDILKNINDSDCMILGFDPKKSRPENMIHKSLPVAPVAVRPSAKVDFMESSSKEDDLTHKLADIIRANIRLRKNKESSNEVSSKYSSDFQNVLQFHVFTNLNNESTIVPKSEQKSKATKSYNSRLKGKEGRVRSNLMGKRVNFSGRTVITGEPNIDVNQLRVPVKIASNLTFPEVVTPQNIEKLSLLVKNGRDVYPGANFVFPASSFKGRKNVTVIDLRFKKDKIDLKFGDIVERHIVDDDYVLLNRQPTLHKLSMMAFRVKVFNDPLINTFGLNPISTKSFNADFDGDEMNIFLPQSNQTRIELEDIADVQRQVITPALSVPILGIIQDGLVGGYNLSQPTMKIDWKTAMNVISYTTLDDFSAFKKNTDVNGSDLFSLIIPSKINASGNLEVKNGKIIKGSLGAPSLGSTKPQSLIHLIWDEYGYEETRKFFDNAQRLINNFNLWNGFSVGIGDIDISKELETEIKKIIETKKVEINHLITEMENNSDLIPLDVFEDTIKAELDAVRPNFSKTITEQMNPNNGFGRMVWAGSKGNPDNIGQMGGCLGQQSVEGKRMQKKYNGRATQYFHQHDDSALGRGFIEQPFYTGIHATSFIFHNMGSREGLIDTAIKSVTGDTPIIIIERNETKRVLIGDWIDNQLELSASNVEHYTEREMELLKLTDKVYIPTCDYKGNVSWGEISAITRHDPGKELYEIKTLGGRQVIVTESKSLLIWNDEAKEFEMMSTPDVKVGNFVPVTMKLNKFDEHTYEGDASKLDMQTLLNMLSAPNDAIREFVNRYLQNGNEIQFDNFELADIFCMLLNRLNIFCEIHENKLTLHIPTPNITHNDVVLDAIIEINKINVAKYPKVYDLTVPSTLNFGLANGLHVVDTAESGYVQRKLIKSLEDIGVKYDGTVRSSSNNIVQFIYGDSGVDTARQSKHPLLMLEMSNSTIAEKVKFTDQELKKFNLTKTDNETYYKGVIELRNVLRKTRLLISENNITFENGFMLPVNLKTTVANIKNSDVTDDGDLDPKYIIERIEAILDYGNTKITSMTAKEYENKKSLRYRDEMIAKSVFRFSLYEHLSPKICIFDHELKKKKFDMICDRIIDKFNKSIVDPGEMVGIIAAQSIGEPTTQFSMDKNTMIIAYTDDINGKTPFYTTISDFIDNILSNNPSKVIKLDNDNDSVLMNLDFPQVEHYIIGVSKDEKSSWKKISQISRHYANGKLVKVYTKSGKTTTATLSHSFLKRETMGITSIKGSDLKVGDRIPIAKYIPEINNPLCEMTIGEKSYKLDKLFGWICGAYIADGNISGNSIVITKILIEFENKIREFCKIINADVSIRNYQGEYGPGKHICFKHKHISKFLSENFGNGSYNKKIGSFVFISNNEFISGLLSGLFDGDGNISETKQQIRYSSISEKLIKGMCILTAYCGVFGSKLQETSINYPGQIQHTFCLQRKYAKQFKAKIGLYVKDKSDLLDKIIDYNDRDNKHSDREDVDMIPGLGNTIASIGSLLKLPGQSRLYGRFAKKEAIGRKTLEKYVKIFNGENEKNKENKENIEEYRKIKELIGILEQAINGNVIWDKIVKLEYIDDPHEYVYDFTVPGNDTFMVDEGIFVHNTLNSIDWKDNIVLLEDGKMIIKEVGSYIDEKIDTNQNVNGKVKRFDNNGENEMGDTYYVDTSNDNIMTISVDEDGKLEWNKVSALTKHLPINLDGTSDLVKVTTRSGRTVTATKAKSFLTRIDNKIVPTRGDELKVGMRVPVIMNYPEPDSKYMIEYLDMSEYFNKAEYSGMPDKIKLDNDFGFLIGSHLAEQLSMDLCEKLGAECNMITKLLEIICNVDSEQKIIPHFAFNSPLDFAMGLLNGYFSGNSNANENGQIVSCASTSEKLIDGLALLLSKLSTVCTKIDKNNEGMWALCIDSENVLKFTKGTLFCLDSKQDRLNKAFLNTYTFKNGENDIIPGNNLKCLKGDIHRDKIQGLLEDETLDKDDIDTLNKIMNSDVVFDEIISIETVAPSHKYVYDLTVENLKTFLLGSGIIAFDTFHGAGTKSATSLGVPRVKELLSLSKNIKTPAMNIYLEDEYKTDSTIANLIASHLKQTTIMDIRTKIDIYYDPDPLNKDGFMAKDNAYNVFYSHSSSKYAVQTDIQSLPWLLRIELNREAMYEKDITLLDIKSKYCNNWESRYEDMKSLKKEEKGLLEKITQTAIISNSDNDINPVIHIRFDMEKFDFVTLVSFIDVFVDNFKLKGLSNISKIQDVADEAVVSFNNNDEELRKEKQYVIYTAGVNLNDIRYMNGVDLNKTVCNDIMTIYETYGIDATCLALIREFKTVFSGAGNNVNFAHLELLCDFMCNLGIPISIDRHGIGKTDMSPFARASFEKTVDQLIQAAVFSEVDKMDNVSSRIMAGMVIKGGTGLCEVVLDSDLLEKSEYVEDMEQKYVKTYNEVSQSNIIADVINKEEVGGFFMPEF